MSMTTSRKISLALLGTVLLALGACGPGASTGSSVTWS
jgi:hypothetical protein